MSLVAIEFDSEARPCRLIRASGPQPEVLDILATGHTLNESDVNYCRRDDQLYVSSVGGWTGRIYLSKLMGEARHRLWVRDYMTFSEASGGGEMISAARVAELGYDLDYNPDRPDWAPTGWSGGVCYWCDRCNDMIPDSEPCECVYWCDDCGAFMDKKWEQCAHFCTVCEQQTVELCAEVGHSA